MLQDTLLRNAPQHEVYFASMFDPHPEEAASAAVSKDEARLNKMLTKSAACARIEANP
jgi:hypothetical protein